MKILSVVAEAVQASTTMAIDAMYKQMRADGADVIGFGAGEPDFDTPEYVKKAGIQAILDNQTRYTPPAGIEVLRQAVCDRLKADCNVSYSSNQIVIGSGAKHNLHIALKTLLNPGDEVILPAPYWVSYFELIRMAGGVPVIIQTTEDSGFKITAAQLKEAVTVRTKALILNNPGNPTGMLYDKEVLSQIAEVAVQEDLYVIADEIYYSLIYDNREFISFAALGDEVKERTILINGVSKSYAMTGWRIGYAATPDHIAKIMQNYVSHAASAPSSISQWAALEALKGSQDGILEMREAFELRRDYIYDRLNQIDGVSCIRPEGAFYIMMNLEKLIGRTCYGTVIQDADDFAELFLKKGQVAVVPCTGFGAPHYVRWSYATSLDHIKEGLNRLEIFLKNV